MPAYEIPPALPGDIYSFTLCAIPCAIFSQIRNFLVILCNVCVTTTGLETVVALRENPEVFDTQGLRGCLVLIKKMHIYKLSNSIRFSLEVPKIICFVINSCILF